ncbi:hypothetical protein [Limosilactobacillus fastidiosus]|uniref:Uncharacterized protein n=1 Tax=Limosilactobacillus fastidiosus TaxID=2759855 RepID=A0A7W3YBY4_9LACO|nr:hypothetical protein [Limosilactobacillus fastidiosus]MBB1063157.1 hypothetical protein [Limosilactobacillus fastidiosus]MBB1085427.1 hypothetical protein [Limosilactobacillus fastidiosus]MCD7083728.1 hypothetical protein [Limosilactobacillus fastidiosus]MCD7085409.1 hypothetical protein [Limosilactobacillus fastidiosus]MCD7114826.1 hypothetical protein [Limosilactobacillus fastidiosus]
MEYLDIIIKHPNANPAPNPNNDIVSSSSFIEGTGRQVIIRISPVIINEKLPENNSDSIICN